MIYHLCSCWLGNIFEDGKLGIDCDVFCQLDIALLNHHLLCMCRHDCDECFV